MYRTFDEDFATRLGAFLLSAFAAGYEIEGEWHVATTDDVVPDFVVVVIRDDVRWGDRLEESEVTFERCSSPAFRSILKQFFLVEFAHGEDIEGMWTIRYAWEELPQWTVWVTPADAP